MGQNFSSNPYEPGSEAERFARCTLEHIKSLREAEGSLWARLMRACVKGDVAKIRAAAESVPVGNERQVVAQRTLIIANLQYGYIYSSLLLYSPHLRNENVIHICAHLGHLEGMNAILDTWTSRPPFNTMAPKADVMKWLVNSVSSDHFTPLIIAVRNGHTDIVECLLTEWHADTMYCDQRSGEDHFFNCNVLHFCAQNNQYKCADLILSSCDTSIKLSLLQCLGVRKGLYEYGKTPLEIAILSDGWDVPGSQLKTIMAIANPKWEQPVLSAMEKRKPLKFAFARLSHGEQILEYLCSVFSEGLGEALIIARSRHRRFLLNHPKLPGVINQQVQFHDGTLTPLYFSVAKGSLKMVIQLLTVGADPNVVCEHNVCWALIHQLHYDDRGDRPMTLAVATNQKDMVREMARCGGILTPEFCRDWSNNDPVFSLASYLNGSWEEHLKSLSTYKASLPVTPRSKLCASMPLVNESITSMMIQYKAEITGVLELLDIESLGRIQQTSKFWYQMGRANSLWKSALLNTSMKWGRKFRNQLILSTRLLDDGSTKWKHAAFFWMARNVCLKCGYKYRRCETTYCAPPGLFFNITIDVHKPVPKYVYKELHHFSAVLRSLRKNKKNEE
ncbi:hypothetical protein Pelo_17762 [Pelomyxa schiedti]|nr:hypothetical protein Pelo_17762 [Pelomyxa schiedti]